jgi:hypothetical protein
MEPVMAVLQFPVDMIRAFLEFLALMLQMVIFVVNVQWDMKELVAIALILTRFVLAILFFFFISSINNEKHFKMM